MAGGPTGIINLKFYSRLLRVYVKLLFEFRVLSAGAKGMGERFCLGYARGCGQRT